jgi:flagellin-like hook-associated protein FlgL
VNDSINFSVSDNVKQIEIEPGVWVPEGISFREAFGNAYNFNDERSRNVLRDALLFVESLERSAQSGALEAGFVDRQNDIIQSTDQIMQYRMRAGAIDAQNDLARSALETKMTELQVHKGRLLDTDVAEASAGLVRAQSLLEAARSIFSRLESSNLFNRLG